VAALSIATDLGTGQPLEHALRTAVLAVRLGELAGASTEELADTYYVALLHASGCTSNGHEAAQLFGDDIAHRAAFYLVDPTNPAEVLEFYRSNVGLGRPAEVRSKMVEVAIASAAPRAREAFATMCEVAQRFAAWFGLNSNIQAALEYVFARWDGLGVPDVAGDAIPLPMRLLHVARDASLFLSAGGLDGARAVVEDRAGAAYEPRLAELAARNLDELLGELDETRIWEQALESEPAPLIWLAADRIDAAFGTIAAITGLKSPWLREHCTSVAELAEAAAWRMDLPADSVTVLRHAALAHDLGRVGVSNAIWEKPGPLGFGEWERVRLHSHFTSAPSHSRPHWPRSGCWPALTTSGWTAPATTAAAAGRRSTDAPASSPPRIATSPCASPGPTGPLSTRRRRRRSCCTRRRRAGSTRRRWTPCSQPPATASPVGRWTCRRG
jgi:hypothetical protein